MQFVRPVNPYRDVVSNYVFLVVCSTDSLSVLLVDSRSSEARASFKRRGAFTACAAYSYEPASQQSHGEERSPVLVVACASCNMLQQLQFQADTYPFIAFSKPTEQTRQGPEIPTIIHLQSQRENLMQLNGRRDGLSAVSLDRRVYQDVSQQTHVKADQLLADGPFV